MYGGGMYGGMGGMYGGGLGMGSGMYGGMGMGSGMYGGMGMGSGMYGSSGLMGGSSYGMGSGLSSFGRNNQFGANSNALNSLGNNGDISQNNGAQSPLNLQQQSNGANQLSSPINQQSSLPPPLNESPEERSRRIHAEHKKERQLIRQQREQHRQARLQARMEIVGHLTNVLVQGLRSAMELFGVCFGTYYSMKAVRAFSNVQDRMPGMGMHPNYAGAAAVAKARPVTAGASGAHQVASAASGGGSKWRTWLLCIALFILGEVVYAVATHHRSKPAQQRRRIIAPTEDVHGHVISQEEGETSRRSSDAESLLTEEESNDGESLSDGQGQALNANGTYQTPLLGSSRRGNGVRRVYYALYDYEAPQTDGSCLSFKAGDEFIVEDYAEGSWCEATAVAGGNYTSRGPYGLVPSNFLRLAERATKL